MDEIEWRKAIWKKKGPSLFEMLCAYLMKNLRNVALIFNKMVNIEASLKRVFFLKSSKKSPGATQDGPGPTQDRPGPPLTFGFLT